MHGRDPGPTEKRILVKESKRHEAAIAEEKQFRDRNLFPLMAEHERALVRSQGGPLAGMSLTVAPSNPHTHLETQLFRVLLLRRLRLPLPLSSRTCRCGRLLDMFGHHGASCALAGVLGKRGFAVESITARICRQAGGRVSMNVFVRDLELPVPVNDARRLEVVVDGLPLFGGAQLAVDSTLVSALHCDGNALRGAGDRDGVALVADRRRKERTHPELVRPGHRARLVVIAGEVVAGKWSEEAASFLRHFAKAKSRCEPAILKKRAEQGWRLRWGSMVACGSPRFCSVLVAKASSWWRRWSNSQCAGRPQCGVFPDWSWIGQVLCDSFVQSLSRVILM